MPNRATADTSLLTASALSLFDEPQAEQAAPADANAGPVRLVRFSMLTGDVTWRDSADGSWSQASPNMPLRQGAQIWVADGGRAEIQFDDGNRVRLEHNTLITIQTLFSDSQGEFTEITLNDGQIYLRLNNKYSLYQVNTPLASLKATGPGQIRVGGGQGAQFGVRSGAATIEGAAGKANLNAGDYLEVTDANAAYNVGGLPQPDAWDSWNLSRDEGLDNAGRTSGRYLPPNVALVADDLGQYGSWHSDPQYGWVWSPRDVASDWRPYRAGSWTWVEPFGWTWVSSENWGWAPYHYGTWAHMPYGWAWVPGPTTQYWSPGVVSFTESAGVVAWCPLAPGEVRYPTRLALGFSGGGNWSMFFSIGGAAVYYPTGNRYCEATPFRNNYVNRVTYINHVTNVTNVYNVTNITVNHNTYLTSARFVPANARWQGGTQVQSQSFGGRAVYQPAPGGNGSIFARGQVIGGPSAGHPVAGPQSVRVTAQSLTPNRIYHAPNQLPQQIVNRTVYRASLPENVPHAQGMPQTGQRFTGAGSLGPAHTSVTGSGRPNTPVTGSGRPNTGIAGTRPTGTGNTTTGPGFHPPTTSAGNPSKNTGSSGLDKYLQERAAHNGNTGSTGTSTGNKTPTTGNRTDTSSNFPGRTHTPGDTTTSPRTDSTRRTGDTSNSPRFDPTHRTGDTTNPPKTDSTTGTGSHTSGTPKTPTGDSTRTFHPGQPPLTPGTGKDSTGKGASGTSGSSKGASSTGGSGKSGSGTGSDSKSKDKDNSKDHKNP